MLQKAECITERELKQDLWNVLLKTQCGAFLYEEKHKKGEEKSAEKAVAYMIEGLEMAIRLGKPIDHLNNSPQILEFISRYPDEFPEEKFQFPSKSARSK